MEKAASQSTSVPAFKRTVTQGSSHRLWQMGYQHLCLLTTKQQKGCQAIPSPRYGRLASIICPLSHFCKHLSSSPRSPPCSVTQQPGELCSLGLSSLFPADMPFLQAFCKVCGRPVPQHATAVGAQMCSWSMLKVSGAQSRSF